MLANIYLSSPISPASRNNIGTRGYGLYVFPAAGSETEKIWWSFRSRTHIREHVPPIWRSPA